MGKTEKAPTVADRVVDDEVVSLMLDKFLTPPLWMSGAECYKKGAFLDELSSEHFPEKYCSQCSVKQKCEVWSEKHSVYKTVFGGELKTVL